MPATPDADDLYSLPLDEFTPARDEMAKVLRSEGDKEAASAVKSLRKPSLPAWAVNQLARREADSLHRLLTLREELANAGDAKEIRRLSGERRQVLSHLVERAGEILDEAGHSSAASTIDSVSKTLQAGGTEEERDRLVRGALDRPLEPSGFEGLGAFDVWSAAPEENQASAGPSAATRRKAEKLAADAERAAREAGELSAQAEEAARAAETAAKLAEKAVRRAEQLRKKADAALDELA